MPGRDVAQHGHESLAALARRRLRGRNLALLGVLGGMALLFYLLTFIILGDKGL
jgi:hypothetical protein